MYTRIETDAEYTLYTGERCVPVATLACPSGGRVQIDIDDHCYVLRLKRADGQYKTTPYIFKEAFEALVSLPAPK